MVTEAIKPGYKQTEIGIIPEDWDLLSFDQVFDFLSTATYSRAELTEYGDILYVHYGDIHTRWNHFLDLKKESLPAIKKSQQKTYALIKEGDVIMADASEDYEGIGKSVEVKNIEEKKIISGLHTFLLRDKKSKLANGFRGYIHSNSYVKKQFDRLATGLKVYGVSKNNLKTVLIPVPKEEKEQQAIAQALSETDELIEHLNKLITKKKDIKKGAMQELLTGKKRLPGFDGGWEKKELGKIANFEHGRGLSKSDLQEEGKKCIHYGQLFTEYKELINNITSKTKADGNIVLSKTNDVLMPTSDVTPRGLATASCIKENGVILGGGILIIRLHEGYDGTFLSYFITQNKEEILKLTKGSTVFHIYASDLSNLEIKFPSYDEQIAIIKVLSEIEQDIDELESELNKYKMVKEGMMQQLLTGKVRLKWK